jgi:glycine cleavage system H protein
VGEIFAPVAGEVVEANDSVVASPDTVNADPYGAGWLIKVRFSAMPDLLDAAAYRALIGA